MAKNPKPPAIPARRTIAVAKAARTDLPEDPSDIVEGTDGAAITLRERRDPAGPKVTAVVPKGYTLTRDDGGEVPFAAGTQEMFQSDAEHWYSRAMGVQIYSPS